MKITRSILCLLAVIAIVRTSFYREAYVDRSIREILRSTVRHDVIIRIRERDMNDRARSLLELVTRALITTWPSQIIVSESLGSRFLSENVASTRTLFIYIHASDRDIDHTGLNLTLDEIRTISHPKHVPRFLLITSSGTDRPVSSTTRLQFEHLWDQRFFDAIILEVSFLPRHLEPVLVAACRFNGFNEDYSRLTVYEDGVDWYPNKLRDMHGSTLMVTFMSARPYGTLEPGSERLGGLAKVLADTLTIAMNATVVHTRLLRLSDLIYDAEKLVYTDWYNTSYEHTVTIDDDRVCLLLPVLPTERILLDLTRITATILIGLLLTAIVWCVSMVLSISQRVRDPLNIISLILGIAPLYQPRTLIEKILFVAMMVTAMEYTSIFQTELFRFVIKYTGHVRVSTIEDVLETGLEILILPTVYKELATIEDLGPGYQNRFRPVAFVGDRGTRLDTTKAYFISEIDGQLAEITNVDRRGRRLFRLYDLCIMRFNRVHTLPVRSPYRNEINGALLSLIERGLAKKHIDDFWKNEGARDIGKKNRFSPNDHSTMYLALLVILAGFSISLVVFVGELIAACFRCANNPVCIKRSRFCAN